LHVRIPHLTGFDNDRLNTFYDASGLRARERRDLVDADEPEFPPEEQEALLLVQLRACRSTRCEACLRTQALQLRGRWNAGIVTT